MNYQEKYTEWITSDYFDEKTKDELKALIKIWNLEQVVLEV